MPLHKPQRADFGRKPVARIVTPRRILLQRENAGAAANTPDAAVAASADDPVHLDRATDEGARDVGRLRPCLRQAARKDPLLDVAPGRANDMRSASGIQRSSCPDNKMRSTFGGNAGIEQHLLEVIDEVRARKRCDAGKLLSPRAFKKYVRRAECRIRSQQAVRRHPVHAPRRAN